MFCFVYQSYLLLAEKFFHKVSWRGLSIICLNFNCIFIFYYEFFEGFYVLSPALHPVCIRVYLTLVLGSVVDNYPQILTSYNPIQSSFKITLICSSYHKLRCTLKDSNLNVHTWYMIHDTWYMIHDTCALLFKSSIVFIKMAPETKKPLLDFVLKIWNLLSFVNFKRIPLEIGIKFLFRNQNGFRQQNNIFLVMKIILLYFMFQVWTSNPMQGASHGYDLWLKVRHLFHLQKVPLRNFRYRLN